jgi:hypothetical protein
MRNGHFAILATLIWVASATTARAETTVSQFKIKGETVEALFDATDPADSCLEFLVSVVASDNVEKTSPPKSKVAAPRTILTVILRDTCTGFLLFSGQGESLVQEFQLAGNLQSATLQTTVSVIDAITRQSFDFDVDLTWTGTGAAVRENFKESFRDRDLGIFIKSQFHGVAVPAEAVGTVVGFGHNFTPEPSDSAQIQRRNDSSLVIEKTN